MEEFITKQHIFLERPDIQKQLLAIFITLLVSWFLSKLIWHELEKALPKATEFTWGDERLPPDQYLALVIQNLDFPIISIILVKLMQILFIQQNWIEGLFNVTSTILQIYFVYRLVLVSLYATFSIAKVRQYHCTLFAPLLIVFILRTIIGLSNNLEDIAQISPVKLFNYPVSLGDIFVLTIGLYIWIISVTLIEDVFRVFFYKLTQVNTGRLEAALILLRYFLITLGIVIILGYIGVDGTALAAISGGLSIGIGFGFKEVISNFVSGIFLLFEGVLKPGDMISIDDKVSKVKKLGIRATTVTILSDNSEKIIPNQTFFISDVTTYTGSDCLVNCSITVGVSYNSDIKQVMQLLLQIAHEHSQVLKAPEPIAFFLNFGDSSLNFELKFWLSDIKIRKRVISDINCEILERFNQSNIEIPFPQRDIHIKNK